MDQGVDTRTGEHWQRRQTPRRPKWLLRLPDPDSPALLLCFPYSGSGASSYHRWPRRVGAFEVCPVQLPGREDRLGEPHHGTYRAAAEAFAADARDLLDRPYVLFGHCDGALVAAEFAAVLADSPGVRPPDRVFVSSMAPPDRRDFAPMLTMDDAELAGVLDAASRARGGGGGDPELTAMTLRVMRADIEAFRRYDYGSPDRFRTPVTVLGWSRDDMVAPELLAGWERFSQDSAVVLDGGHWDFLAAPEVLLDRLRLAGPEPPRWPAEFEIVLRRYLPALDSRAALPPAARLFDLGLDSIRTVELLVDLESSFDLVLPDDALTEETFATVESLWTVIAEALGHAEADRC